MENSLYDGFVCFLIHELVKVINQLVILYAESHWNDQLTNGLSPPPTFIGVQQLSVQHLPQHNPYLTSSFTSASHLHQQQHRLSTNNNHNSLFCPANRDSHLFLDDHQQDKHASASSPTTTSSDRCLLPAGTSSRCLLGTVAPRYLGRPGA